MKNNSQVEDLVLHFAKINLMEMRMINNLIYINNDMCEDVNVDFSDILEIGVKNEK